MRLQAGPGWFQKEEAGEAAVKPALAEPGIWAEVQGPCRSKGNEWLGPSGACQLQTQLPWRKQSQHLLDPSHGHLGSWRPRADVGGQLGEWRRMKEKERGAGQKEEDWKGKRSLGQVSISG